MDTVLVRLYAEEKDSQSILSILNHSNDCDIAQAEESLLNAGQFSLLASVYEKEGEIAKTLEIWTKWVLADSIRNLLTLIQDH